MSKTSKISKTLPFFSKCCEVIMFINNENVAEKLTGNSPEKSKCIRKIKQKRRSIFTRCSLISVLTVIIFALIVHLPLCNCEDASNDRDENNSNDNSYDNNAEYNVEENDDDRSSKFSEFYGSNTGTDDYDYTASNHRAKTYVSSITDVILCLFCTFFWVLWLVGTIFPNKMQDLYRNEGVIVKGDVEDCTCIDDDNSEGYGLGVTTYRLVVSYVVPGKFVASIPKSTIAHPRNDSVNNKEFNEESNINATSSNHDSIFVDKRQRSSTDYSKNRSLLDVSESKSFDGLENGDKGESFNETSGKAQTESAVIKNLNNTAIENMEQSQIYNKEQHLYQDPEQIGNCMEIFGISQFFPQQKPQKNPLDVGPVRVRKRFETSEVFNLGKRCIDVLVLPGNPTSGMLKSEFDEQEIIIHGGTGQGSSEISGPNSPSMSSRKDSMKRINGSRADAYTDQCTTAMIGIVLVAVSTIGAVNAALKLPYQTRSFGWIFLTLSLTFMWPAAMFTYKTIHKLRIFMMNKIISFEPCGSADASGLYDLGALPPVGMNCNTGGKLNSITKSARASALLQENRYFIMMDNDGGKNGTKKGVFCEDEDSAISSLSGEVRRIV